MSCSTGLTIQLFPGSPPTFQAYLGCTSFRTPPTPHIVGFPPPQPRHTWVAPASGCTPPPPPSELLTADWPPCCAAGVGRSRHTRAAPAWGCSWPPGSTGPGVAEPSPQTSLAPTAVHARTSHWPLHREGGRGHHLYALLTSPPHACYADHQHHQSKWWMKTNPPKSEKN